MYVVATAGHVDHGKSTLVRALTGQDPDRLEEERRRGLSIELGYCWTSLPGVGEVAFVDVPGHQRFIATTLAGMGPVPVVMFVVAADDPWMPQSAEHLAALDALGVSHGVLVVTRSDLADPRLALGRAQAELATTSLAGAPSVVVSGRTGAGLDELRDVLVGVLLSVPRPDPEADVRLWVDRRFHVRGSGTVVTGTLQSGTVVPGQLLEAEGEVVRVRGIEALDVARTSVSAPARVALNLGGRVAESVSRGSALLTPEAFEWSRTIDVRLSHPGPGPESDPESHAGLAPPPDRPMLHVGSASFEVHVRPLDGRLVRLRLPRPLPLRIGDRALLRDPGSREVWGVEVLDPLAQALWGRGAAQARAKDLSWRDGSLGSQLQLRGVVRASQLRRLGVDLEDVVASGVGAAGPAVTAGDWLLAPERAEILRTKLAALVAAVPTSAPPLTRAAAAHALGVEAEIVSALVEPPLREEGGAILDSSGPVVPPELEPALAELRATLAASPYAPPARERMRALGLDARALAILERAGAVLRLPGDLVLLPGADLAAVEVLRELPQPFTTSAARQALGTSRRVVLPLLDHLDRTGHTVRLADDTRRLRPTR